MKIVTKYPLIASLIVLNLTICAVLIWNYEQKLIRRAAAAEKARVATAVGFDKAKYIKKDDYLRLTERDVEWVKSGKMTDMEMAWCLNLLRSNPNTKSINGKLPLQMMVATRIQFYIKSFSHSQREMILHFAQSAFRGDGGMEGNDYIVATMLVAKTKDTRIIPDLLPLLGHKNKAIADDAQKLVDYLSAKGK